MFQQLIGIQDRRRSAAYFGAGAQLIGASLHAVFQRHDHAAQLSGHVVKGRGQRANFVALFNFRDGIQVARGDLRRNIG